MKDLTKNLDEAIRKTFECDGLTDAESVSVVLRHPWLIEAYRQEIKENFNVKDLSKIKAGDTLILRNGGREVCTEVTDRWFAADCFSWKKSGDYFEYKKSNFDIIDYEPAPEEKEHSGKLYWFKGAKGSIDCLFVESPDILEGYATDEKLIAITPVMFKEGEGL